ncbi:MAG: septum formation initiator family protein [Chloroflexi bacterium]|nr:septum formation initiator family protein [Chloroflexota bacterium]
MPKKRKQSPDNVLKIKFRKAWHAYRLFAIALFAIALLAWAIYPIKYRNEQQRQIADYKGKIEALTRDNERIKKEIVRLNTDDYVEQLARKDLGLAKPGEEVYVVYGGDDTRSAGVSPADRPQPAKSNPPARKASFWQRLLKIVGL